MNNKEKVKLAKCGGCTASYYIKTFAKNWSLLTCGYCKRRMRFTILKEQTE